MPQPAQDAPSAAGRDQIRHAETYGMSGPRRACFGTISRAVYGDEL